jgi:SNF2 family DNA or RNA helicase
MEQGTGKTPVAVYAANMIGHQKQQADGRPAHVLVVVPSNLRRNWEREFQKFSKARGRVICMRGGRMKRLRALTTAFTNTKDLAFVAVIVSYDVAVNDAQILSAIPWDLGVADEIQYFKSQSTKRWKAMLKIRDSCQRRMGLTGSPIGNSILDMFTQMEWAGEHYSTCTSLEEFKRVFADVEVSGAGFEKVVGTKNHARLTEQLSKIAIIVDKRTALPDLPEKTYDLLEAEMTSRQQKIYDEVATKLIIEAQSELSSMGGSNVQMNAQHILTKLLRLSQITSGFVVWTKYPDGSMGAFDDGDVEFERVIEALNPNPKIDVLVETLKEKDPAQRTIVWTPWVEDIRAITERLRAEGLGVVQYYGGMKPDEKDVAEDQFNDVDSGIDVLVGNQTAGGVGLNLLGHKPGDETPKRYCDHMIYYAVNWSYLARTQSEARAHRRGTTCHIRVTDLLIPGTIDEEIRMRVAQKKLNAELVTDVQNIIDSLASIYGV